MSDPATSLCKSYPYLSVRKSADWPAVNCPADHIVGFLSQLQASDQFDFLADVTAIDHYDRSPRYEVLYHLYNTAKHEYLRVATPCAGDANPVCPSVAGIWPTADWHERETYDMFGIEFAGHPDLRRILMWDDYPYYPLRKEFPLAGIEVELPNPDTTEATGGAKVKPAPMMGGPFHASQHGSMAEREPRADDESWTEQVEKSALEGPAGPREFISRGHGDNGA